MGLIANEKMKPKLTVVKIGGNIIESPSDLEQFLDLFSMIEGHKILVHGGGKRATEIGERLGVRSEYHQGRRITDSDSLDVAIMVYGGLVNKKITARLQSKNCNALGLSGADGGVILANKRPVTEVDFGLVGDIEQVRAEVLHTLLYNKIVPVFCALTHDRSGQLLNTNADTIASEVAIGLSTSFDTHLYYCFEKKGVLANLENEESVIPHIDKLNYHELLEKKVISDGMLPKLHNCFYALEQQVSRIYIGNLTMFEQGTNLYTSITL